MAITSSPTRSASESASVAAGSPDLATRSTARSRAASREISSAETRVPSHNWTSIGLNAATCAFVTIIPSGFTIVPDPCPRRPAPTCTVDRRSFSAISPKPGTGILGPPSRALAYGESRLLRHTGPQEFDAHGLPDYSGIGVGLEVVCLLDGDVAHPHDDVS